MNEERQRILQMFAEGKVSLEECDELLGSLQQRQAEVEKEADTTTATAPLRPQLRRRKTSWIVWVVVALLAAMMLRGPLSMLLHRASSTTVHVGDLRPTMGVVEPIVGDLQRGVGVSIFLPALLLILVLSIFWLWALIDCLTRDRADFATSITEKHDKLVWLLFIIFLPVIGALAYYFVVGRYVRQSLPEASKS